MKKYTVLSTFPIIVVEEGTTTRIELTDIRKPLRVGDIFITDESHTTIMYNVPTTDIVLRELTVSAYQYFSGKIPLDDVFNVMTKAADYLCYYGIRSASNMILDTFGYFDGSIHKVIRYWYKEYNIRRLQLLGIDESEIELLAMSPSDIFDTLFTKPSSLLFASINAIAPFIETYEPKYDKEMISYARGLIKDIDKHGYLAIDNVIASIADQLPGIKKLTYSGQHYITTMGEYNMSKVIINWFKSMRSGYIKINTDGFNECQVVAADIILSSPCSYMYGYPGTGKTFVANRIQPKDSSLNMVILCPTGIATTHIKGAVTIHMAYYSGALQYADIIMIDEISMVDMQMMWWIARCASSCKQIILIGEHHQLPPVGVDYGRHKLYSRSVIQSLMNTSLIKCVQLIKVMRNDALPSMLDDLSRGRSILQSLCGTISYVGNVSPVDIWRKLYHDNGNRYDNIRIVTAYNNDCRYINGEICKYLYGKDIVGVGTPILFTKNNYDQRYFNGEIGYICKVGMNGNIFVQLNDGSIVEPPRREYKIAFAVTVYASQGGQSDYIIFYMSNYDTPIITRELIRVAITRYKCKCVITGNADTINLGCTRSINRETLIPLLHRIEQ